MITEKGLTLITQMDRSQVDWRLALDCLQSASLFEQGVSFELLTGRLRDEIVPNFPDDVDVPMLLLEFLLNCIETDISSECEEQCDGIVYDRGGAFLDLRIPLDPYWKKHNCELTDERFFQRIAEFLLRDPADYQDRLPTHVLEAWSPRQKPFFNMMKSWKRDPVLKVYVEDLEKIRGCSL